MEICSGFVEKWSVLTARNRIGFVDETTELYCYRLFSRLITPHPSCTLKGP